MHQHITINGKTYTAEEASLLKDLFTSEYGEDSFMASLGGFLAEWYNKSPLLKVHTSGSTGTPKELWVEKERMMNSARLTVSFLGLKAGDSALLCMTVYAPPLHSRKNGGSAQHNSRPQPYGGYSMRTPTTEHNRDTRFRSHDTDAGVQLTATS